MVFEYRDGNDLSKVLPAIKKPLSEEIIRRWASQLLKALETLLNVKKFLHSDVSLRNILITAEVPENAKLMDFGVATVRRGDGNGVENRLHAYTAPECLNKSEGLA